MSQDTGRVAVCPRCEAEYLATAIECTDCGVALVHPEQLRPSLCNELCTMHREWGQEEGLATQLVQVGVRTKNRHQVGHCSTHRHKP